MIKGKYQKKNRKIAFEHVQVGLQKRFFFKEQPLARGTNATLRVFG